MLAQRFARLNQLPPIRYALSPLQLMTQSLLAGPAFRHLPLQYPGHRHSQPILRAEGLHKSVLAGQHEDILPLLSVLQNSGLVDPHTAGGIPGLRQDIMHMMGQSADHPRIQAYTHGSMFDELANQSTRDYMHEIGSPLENIHRMIGNQMLTHLDFHKIAPALKAASTSGSLHDILMAHHAARTHLGHMNNSGFPMQNLSQIWRQIHYPLEHGMNARRSLADFHEHSTAESHTRPGEMLPEDYYAR